jgi:hypothetical protein
MEYGVPPAVWLILVTLGALALGFGLGYGTMMWRTRSRDPKVEEMRERTTKELYQQEAERERRAERRKDAA